MNILKIEASHLPCLIYASFFCCCHPRCCGSGGNNHFGPSMIWVRCSNRCTCFLAQQKTHSIHLLSVYAQVPFFASLNVCATSFIVAALQCLCRPFHCCHPPLCANSICCCPVLVPISFDNNLRCMRECHLLQLSVFALPVWTSFICCRSWCLRCPCPFYLMPLSVLLLPISFFAALGVL